MSKLRIISISAATLVAAGLFYAGMKTTAMETKTAVTKEESTSSLDENKIISSGAARLDANNSDVFRKMKLNFDNARNADSKTETAKKIMSFADSLGLYNISSVYSKYISDVINTPDSWNATAARFAAASDIAMSENEKKYFLAQGKKAARKSLSLDARNLMAESILGELIIADDDSIMLAVTLLKDVELRDSNNLSAVRNLALLSFRSGQDDKATRRFSRLQKLNPMDGENYFYLGELYSRNNKKEEAKKMYSTCKTLTKDAEKISMLEQKISQLK